ncbi:MAG: DUF1360 domain-containing protein [Chromatiaceae bacterium]
MLTLLLTLTTWRLTRLLVRDEFPPTRALREWVIKTFATVDAEGNLHPGPRWGSPGRALAYLWTCTWCMSIWAGAGVVGLADWRLSVSYPWLVVAASSAVSGLLNMLDMEHDQRYRIREQQYDRMEQR